VAAARRSAGTTAFSLSSLLRSTEGVSTSLRQDLVLEAMRQAHEMDIGVVSDVVVRHCSPWSFVDGRWLKSNVELLFNAGRRRCPRTFPHAPSPTTTSFLRMASFPPLMSTLMMGGPMEYSSYRRHGRSSSRVPACARP